MPRMASVSPGAARPGGDDLLHQAWLAFRMDCSSVVDVEGRDGLRRLNAGVALAGVRKLDQAHLEQHLAVPVDELAHGGVEGFERLTGRAKGDGSCRWIDDRPAANQRGSWPGC